MTGVVIHEVGLAREVFATVTGSRRPAEQVFDSVTWLPQSRRDARSGSQHKLTGNEGCHDACNLSAARWRYRRALGQNYRMLVYLLNEDKQRCALDPAPVAQLSDSLTAKQSNNASSRTGDIHLNVTAICPQTLAASPRCTVQLALSPGHKLASPDQTQPQDVRGQDCGGSIPGSPSRNRIRCNVSPAPRSCAGISSASGR